MNSSLRDRLCRFWCADGVFLTLMLGLFALRFLPALAHGALYAPFRDNVWAYGPIFSRASEIALTGQFPYWLDTIFGGFLLYQTPHFSATYPFYFLGFLTYDKDLGSLYALTYVTCFHLLILYLNLYVMLRVAGARGLASLCGSTVGLISGNTGVYAHWITITASYSWLPLFIAGMVRLLHNPRSIGNIVLLSLAASLICTASPSQAVIHAIFLGGIFILAGVLWKWRNEGPAAVGWLFTAVVITGIVIFCLSAVAILPMTLASGNMIRAIGKGGSVVGHAPIPWNSFNEYQLVPGDLSHVLFDSTDLHVVGGPYVGPLALLGVLLVPIAYYRGNTWNRFLIIAFASFALYSLLAGFGTHFGLAYLHFYVPLLNRIREAGRHLVIFTTFASLLTGLGLQVAIDLAEKRFSLEGRCRRYFWIAVAVGLGVFVLALVADRRSIASGCLVLLVAPVALLFIPTSSFRHRITAFGLVSLVCLASVLSPPGTKPFAVSEYLRLDNLRSHNVLRRIATLADIRAYRIAIIDSVFPLPWWGANASYYGIRTFYGNLTPQSREVLWEASNVSAGNFRGLRGAKYWICGQNTTPPYPDARLLFEESGYRIYETPRPMGMYTLVHQANAFDSRSAFGPELERGFDYQHIVALPKHAWTIMNQRIQPGRNNEATRVADEVVKPIVDTPNLRGVLVDSTQPGVLILNERWSRDWHARINSQPAPVMQANFMQAAVFLRPGHNYVEFEFKPMLFWYLLLLQRSTIFVLLLIGLWKILAITRADPLGPPCVQQ